MAGVIRFVLVLLVGLGLIFVFTQKLHPIVTPVGICIIRLNLSAIEQYRYHFNQYLFPPQFKATAGGIMNFVSRLVGALSFVVVEYTDKPVWVMIGTCVAAILITFLFVEPKPESKVTLPTTTEAEIEMSFGKKEAFDESGADKETDGQANKAEE